MKRLHVGLDAREGFRPNPRGIGLYCRHLMREFGAMGPELEVVAYHERPTPPDLPALAANIVPRRCEMRGSRFHLWERVRMPLQMRMDRVDVYHGTYNTLPPRWSRLCAPAMVVSLHDVVVTWWEGDGLDSYSAHVRKVTPRVCREADRILTVSEFSKRDICERFGVPEQKVTIFHNGIPPAFLDNLPTGAAEAARKQYAGGRPYLYCIGSPIRRKNTRGFLDALAILQQRSALHHRVVISGLPGADVESIRAHAEAAGLADVIRFLGYLPHAELAAVCAGADLMVYPSFAEGWGIPVLEAFAVGTPVAASNTTSIPEAGGDFARYFAPDQPEEMAAVIQRCLEDRAGWESKKAAARARARTFTWRAAAEKTLQVYREVC